MTVIDNRATPSGRTFGDLAIGEAFQDDDGDICIKTTIDSAIYWTGRYWAVHDVFSSDKLILPLEVTYTIEREDGRK